ncbi:MAG TPA: 2OG-Fe(II) oxygenase family protein [Allosphingosinicella sp.]|jgi:Rps23 Pro-64 3,4-dihydroxylase Tpa1-like proline 4-hydroxylase
MDQLPYRLSPALDAELLAGRFAATGRLHVADFLAPEDAERLHAYLRASQDWRLVVNQAEKLFELDRAAQAALTSEARGRLTAAVHAAARYGFQYQYESIRVPDEEEARLAAPDPLNLFAAFLSSPAVIDLLRRITGCEGIQFADAQATAYGLGHFLTAHDDEVAGKNRFAAYVFNLTPRWRIDWGGLLAFQRGDGHVAEAFTPSFNALNLFRVPQPHCVTMVAPFAAARRYSVTGWLRGR